VNSIRRHLVAIGVAWLVFQAGVLAVSPFLSCCAAASQTATVDDDKCCEGMAPGQICPLHKHRQAPPTHTHHDDAQGDCAISGGCGTIAPALISLGFGLGVLDPPASLVVTPVSNPVPEFAASTLDYAGALDPPPPR
jgi:hypothetical protein